MGDQRPGTDRPLILPHPIVRTQLGIIDDSIQAPPPYPLSSVYVDDDLVRLRQVTLPDDLRADFLETMKLVSWTVGDKTTQDYQPIIANYWHFCTMHGLDRFHLLTVRDYLYLLAYPRMAYLKKPPGSPTSARGRQPGVGRATLKVILSAISKTFAVRGRPVPSDNPAWKQWIRGLLRRLAQEKDRKDPILREDLKTAVALTRSHKSPLVALRDTAILLIGWSAALRRSELAGIHLEHLRHGPSGWHLFIPKSKTDPMGDGQTVPLYTAQDPEFDAITACQAWASAAAITTGLLFRRIRKGGAVGTAALTGRAIAQILKDYTYQPNVSGHSLRIGYVTQGSLDNRTKSSVRRVTRHKRDTMLDEYTRVIDEHQQGPGTLI